MIGKISIILPNEILEKCENPMVIICVGTPQACKEIKQQLAEFWPESSFCLFDELMFGRHKDEILEVYDMLANEKSKEQYAKIVIARLQGSDIEEELVEEQQYFCKKEFKRKNNNETFVDVGAYVGDTIERYINIREGICGKMYGFEPNIDSYHAFQKRIQRLNAEWALPEDKIIAVNAGVGKENGKACVFLDPGREESSARISMEEDGLDIEIVSLDSYFSNQTVGLIKADVEGFEMEVLQGAQMVIKRDKPKIAICIYHKASDLWEIPRLIKSINTDYKLEIGLHDYGYIETVLYAY